MPLLFTSLIATGEGGAATAAPFTWTTNLLYRFSASEEVFADSAGLVLAANLDPVARWGNQGSGNDALQSTSARRPIFRTGGINGRPYLSCTNSLQQYFEDLPFTQPSGFTGYSPYTVFAVTSGVTNLTQYPALWGSQYAAGGKAGVYFRPDANAQHHLFTSGIRIGNVVNPQILMGAWGRNAAGNTGSISYKWVRQNRVNIFTATNQSTNADSNALTAAQFLRSTGLTTPAGAGYFDGQLYEFLLYTGVLSNTDTFAIENWLATRYGIA